MQACLVLQDVRGVHGNEQQAGLRMQTVQIERLTEFLGAVQSQGDASLVFLSRLSLGAIVIFAAHVVSHMGSCSSDEEKEDLSQTPNFKEPEHLIISSSPEKKCMRGRELPAKWVK
ncbi:hypothetical protein JOB18_002117 [Solea senegalensis]|uniref:Uncharacterized protein n=1 Tax=Solea senegalensis TaxID=28829 RepID=A0AAV6RWD8_SOLSE|nr:hypothetical protein JOB18_002117 [Solea senegalensis]